MKTKKLFLMVAMLLMGMCTFAQSKYLYIGPVEPTAENYKTLATEVTSYNDYYEYENNTGKKCHVFVLVAEDVSVSYRELTLQDRVSQIEHTDVNIPGHKVVETAVGFAATSRVGIDLGDGWKHFYLGTTLPTVDNYEALTPAFSSLSEMDCATVHVPLSGKIYLLVPYSDSPSQKQLKYSFIYNEGNTVTYTKRYYDYTSIYRHYIWELSFEPGIELKYNYVTEFPVTITANNKTMTYGDDVPELTYDSTWTLNGTPEISTTATKTSPVGVYPIKVEKGTLTNEYVTYVDGTLTIGKAPLTVGVQNVTITEGDAIPAFALTYSGFRNNDTEANSFTTKPKAATTATSASKPGTYPITVSGGEAQNYALTYTQGTLTITAKPIEPVTITADNKTMTYGDEVPTLTYKSSGATLNGTPKLSTTATKTSPVGTYPIRVEKGTVTNEQVTCVDGTLTIGKAPLTIKAGTYTKKQGDAMPDFVLTYEGLKNNETSEVLTKQPTVSCDATESSIPGEYTITVTGAESQNYDITYVSGRLIVTEADPVTITAKSYTKKYGDENPVFEYEVSGATLDGTPEILCEATNSSAVGTYSIVVKPGSVRNYNANFVNGMLTVTKAPLKVSVKDVEREQGEENPQFELVYEGWKLQDTESVLLKKPVATTTATKVSKPGTYPITVSGGEARNYELRYVNGRLTVTIPSSINALTESETFDVYDMSGRKVRRLATTLKDLPKGVYVVNGRKLVAK